MPTLRLVALFCVAMLAACSNTTKPSELPQFAISGVSVSTDATVKANSDIAATTRTAAARVGRAYSASLPASVPRKNLEIRITRVHYKNAIASLLVGDTNRAMGTARASGKPAKPIIYVDAGGAVINGVLGAAIAIGSDKAKIDAKLAVGLAEAAVAAAYDQKSTPNFARENLQNGKVSSPARTAPAKKPAKQPANTGSPSSSPPTS